MLSTKITYDMPQDAPSSAVREDVIESGFIGTLQYLKYDYRRDITDRASLERNFREKFESLNRVRLTDSEFARLLDEIAESTNAHSNSYTRNSYSAHNFPSFVIQNSTFVISQRPYQVYAVGSIGLQLLIGHYVQSGLYSIVDECPGLGDSAMRLQTVISQSTEADTERRYRSAAEFANALRKSVQKRTLFERVFGWPRRKL
jgi:hypothetical protein